MNRIFIATGRFFAVLLGLICIVAFAAMAYSIYSNCDYLFAFRQGLMIFALILFLGGLIGVGFSENAMHHSGFYSFSSIYIRTLTEERLKRRQEQFISMIWSVLMGLFLIMIVMMF
jgi:FtsH-binding integral membrane protein